VSSSDPLPAITHERDVDPRARAEKELVAIWCDLLGVDTVGVDDNFMELGGHSLVATQLVRQVREQTGIALSLREFLESPTIAGILGKMTDGGVPDAPALEAIQPDTEHAHDPFPLTDVQAAYWVGRSGDFQLGGIATHIYREVELRGFDVAAAERALRKLIARHGMMRAIVQRDGTQRILPEVPDYMVARMDLRRTDAWEEELLRVRGEMSHQVRAADQWPLWEVRAALLPDDRVRLFMSIDMLLLDAKSIHQLAREWFALYAAPDLELPPVRVSFRDYVVTLERLRDSGAFAPSEEYWRARLDDLPGPPELPLLTAELTKPRFRRLSGVLPSELWEKLKARAARAKVSPSGLLAAVYADVLGAFSTSPKFTINLTLFDTLPIHPDMPRVCGDFTSLTLLAVDVRSAATFEERALRVQQQLWEDLDHRAFGGVRVMRELRRRRGADVSMPVVFTSTLGIGSGARTSDPADQVTKNAEIVYALSQTPQVWLDATVSEGPDGLGYAWNALEELFPDGFLDAMFEVYGDLIRRLATDEAAWQEAGQLPPRDQLALMAAVNDTAEPIPAGLLHEGALRRALEQPGQLAIVGTGYRVTYGELASAAAAVASALEQRGVVPGQLVAIVLPKGWEQVAGVLGVLSAGAAYVPIDPDLPPERQSYLLTNADVTMAVTNREVADIVAWPSEVGRVLVDEVRRSAPSARHSARPRVSPSDLAYVLYTSGSTGLPKGVMISHEGALNTVEDINRRFALCAEDRILALSALSFDLSVYDIFGTLAAGGTLVMPNPSEARDPEAWARLTEANTVTVWNSVPALMEMFVEYLEGTGNAKAGRSLRTVFLSGDWIPITLPERVRRIAPKTKVLSGGGATEASIWSVIYPIDEIDPAWRSIPYGKPLVNQTTHVLGDNLQPCPVWVPGEIYIGGIGVGLGYWRDPERSAKSFITHRGERLYRTGDFGRYLPGGDIEILGRQDSQVKIGGHRVELGEIEITLAAHPAIDTAVVCAPRSASGGRRLHAHVVIRPGQARPTTQELQTFLAGKLPAYMVPRQISPLDKLPLTDRGKIDRKTLESLAVQGGAREEASAAAETSTASTDDAAGPIAALVSRVLGYPVGHDDNLIELGADSVSMVRIVNAMERELRFRPRIVDVFRNPTVRGLVNLHAASTQQVATPNRPASSGIDKILQELKVGGSEPVDPEARARFKVDRFAQLRRRHAEQATAIRLDEGPTDETLRAHLARRSTRRFSTAPVPLSELSRLLTGLRQLTVGGAPKYRYASAGGLYPVVTYLFAKPGRVEGLSAGSYYYDAVQHRLVEVSKSAPNGDCYSAGMGFLVNRPVFESAAFGLFLVVQLGAIAPIYDQASLKFAAIEVGAMAQLLEMEAGRAGMGLCQIGAFDERAVAGNLGLAASEFVFHHLLGGGLDGDAGTPGQPDGSAEYDEFEV
jgi:amino acid adenylation domain-containing protein